MNTARENILKRLQRSQQTSTASTASERLNNPPSLIRPALPENLLHRFTDKLELGGGRLAQCADLGQVEAVIAEYLSEKGLEMQARVSPALQQTLSFELLQVSYGNTRGDDLVSITPALCAVAETGSLVLISGEDTPTSLNFLPDVHIVVIRPEQMVAHIEDAWIRIRALDSTPRTINFITGPSKTADVEQTLQIGAHGPRDLLVILAGSL